MAGDILLVIIGAISAWLIAAAFFYGEASKSYDEGKSDGFKSGYEEGRTQTLLELGHALVGDDTMKPDDMEEHVLHQVWEYAVLCNKVHQTRLRLIEEAGTQPISAQDIVTETARNLI